MRRQRSSAAAKCGRVHDLDVRSVYFFFICRVDGGIWRDDCCRLQPGYHRFRHSARSAAVIAGGKRERPRCSQRGQLPIWLASLPRSLLHYITCAREAASSLDVRVTVAGMKRDRQMLCQRRRSDRVGVPDVRRCLYGFKRGRLAGAATIHFMAHQPGYCGVDHHWNSDSP